MDEGRVHRQAAHKQKPANNQVKTSKTRPDKAKTNKQASKAKQDKRAAAALPDRRIFAR